MLSVALGVILATGDVLRRQVYIQRVMFFFLYNGAVVLDDVKFNLRLDEYRVTDTLLREAVSAICSCDAEGRYLEDMSSPRNASSPAFVICVRYHRILDLGAFRSLISRGHIPADQFVTVLSGRAEYMMRKLKNEQEILHKFTKYVGSQVRTGVEFIFRGLKVGVSCNAEGGDFLSHNSIKKSVQMTLSRETM